MIRNSKISMGVRYRKFACKDCGTMYWNAFEWIDTQDIEALDIHCPTCESSQWEIMAETEFSGGEKEEKSDVGISCNNCSDNWHITVEGLSKRDIMNKTIRCSNNHKDCCITDAVF